VPLAYDVHPDFGYFCPAPRVRRELHVALVSILFGMASGAAIVTIDAGQAEGTDEVGCDQRAYRGNRPLVGLRDAIGS